MNEEEGWGVVPVGGGWGLVRLRRSVLYPSAMTMVAISAVQPSVAEPEVRSMPPPEKIIRSHQAWNQMTGISDPPVM